MENKIFDEFQVDCNTCESYWDNQCDGVKVGTKRNCTSYKATRKVDVVQEVSNLKFKVKWLRVSVLCVELAMIIHLVGHIL